MSITKITDHIDQAKNRLLSQFKDKPNINGLLSALTRGIQDIENAGYDLYIKRWVTTATGSTLDRLGAMVNAERNGANDEQYRTNIIGEINTQFSSGSNDDIILTAKNLTGASFVLFVEEYPATFYIECRGVDNTLIVDIERIKKIIEKSKPAGVQFQKITTVPSEAFSFSEDSTGQGFTLNERPETGGRFAIQL